MVLRDDVAAAVVEPVVEEVPGEVLVRQRDVMAPDAVAELRDFAAAAMSSARVRGMLAMPAFPSRSLL